MNCPVCERETSPVKIGGQLYCSVCGTALAQATPSKRMSLDLAPRSRGVAQPSLPTHRPSSKTAATLHQRTNPSRILDLRQSPKLPAAELKATIHHDPAPKPKTAIRERHQAHQKHRLQKAKEVEKSPHINKFGHQRLPAPEPAVEQEARDTHSHAGQTLPKHVETHHEAMTKLAPHTPTPSKTPVWRPHTSINPSRSRITATIAAAAILAGYVWIQNYPKLALQNASNNAGVAATMPGYIPSSYNLERTDSSPGLITLNFKSPSANEALKIAQARTPWDSSSLLDNYVAKQTDDYATVQGQGLTIYLFGQNRATWVNKGIWFSIEGTGRLSREQILKMAYSL